MKRFWSDVSIAARAGDDGVQTHAILLDGRPLRTPGGVALAVPFAPLAEAIAAEWRAAGKEIDPRAMPLTGLANLAIERIAPEPGPFVRNLAAYAESDLLCYRAETPAALVDRQAAAWDPLIAWARARYDIDIVVTQGIIHAPQSGAMLARLADAVAARSPFALAGLAPIVTISGSLIAALALIEGAADAGSIWQASQIDDDWQSEKWGEDAIALAAREARRGDFEAAVRFLDLIR